MKTLLAIMVSSLLLVVTGCVSIATAQDTGNDTPEKSGFNFIFKYGVTGRNTLDTYHGTFTKDMVMDPAITIELILSAEEMDSVYQKMVEIDFFNYPVEFEVDVSGSELIGTVTPYSTYIFEVEYNGSTKELLWHDEITNPDAQADKLRELINLIRNIIESKEEYQSLPESSGGYL